MIYPILNKIIWAYETVDKNNIVPSISFETMKGTDVELYLANS